MAYLQRCFALAAQGNTNLSVVPEPPDVSERANLAGPQHRRGIDLFVLRCNERERQMDVLQGACRDRNSSTGGEYLLSGINKPAYY